MSETELDSKKQGFGHVGHSPPIPIVYTMGKVASTSTSQAIEAAGLTCYDIHSLDKEYLLRTAKNCIDKQHLPPSHISTAMIVKQKLLAKAYRKLFISLVRDPVERNLSAFFQNLATFPNQIQTETEPEILFSNFMDMYSHRLPISWFDREFNKQLGIDVFSQPFDTEKKYMKLEQDNVVIFRTDCPDETKSRILSELMEREIHIGRNNDSSGKTYSETYSAVRAIARFPPDYLGMIYESKFAKHFWSDKEREQLWKRWSAKV